MWKKRFGVWGRGCPRSIGFNASGWAVVVEEGQPSFAHDAESAHLEEAHLDGALDVVPGVGLAFELPFVHPLLTREEAGVWLLGGLMDVGEDGGEDGVEGCPGVEHLPLVLGGLHRSSAALMRASEIETYSGFISMPM